MELGLMYLVINNDICCSGIHYFNGLYVLYTRYVKVGEVLILDGESALKGYKK